MPPRLALAAALGAAIAVTGCTAAEPLDTGEQPTGGVTTEVDERGVAEGSAGASDAAALQATPLGGQEQPHDGEPGLPVDSGMSIDDVLRTGAVATWAGGGESIAISLPASATCWPTAGVPTVVDERQLSVAFVAPEGCAGADSARTYELELPDGVDASGELEVGLDGLEHSFTLTLPAR